MFGPAYTLRYILRPEGTIDAIDVFARIARIRQRAAGWKPIPPRLPCW